MSVVTFEWDERKAASNKAKHGVSFELAVTAFDDPMRLVLANNSDSDEYRERLLGMSDKGILLVVFTEQHHSQHTVTRIISARKATRKEQAIYVSQNR